MFESNPHAMWVYDRRTLRFLEVNEAAVDRYGYTREEFLSKRIVDIRPPEEVPELLASIDHDVNPTGTRHHIAKDGRIFEVEVASRSTSFHGHGARLVVAYDVTERNEYQRQLEHAAFHDGLTSLANRALLLDRLTTALARARRGGEQVGLIYLDLDNFKVINDSLGHAQGDEVIVDVARRFADAMRGGDTVARIGGDEFVVLCEGIEGLHEAIEIMRRLRHVLAPALFARGRELYVTASAGITTSDGSVNAETMLRRADAAMYSAKQAGPDRYVVFEDRMLTATLHWFDVEAALRSAMNAGEFVLYYQPKVRLDDGNLVGLEALIRWQRPGNGLVPPADFIPVAEATGLIVPIGTWVIREALRQYRAWGLDPHQPVPLTIAVNVSTAQLERADFLDVVREALRDQGLPPRVLLLEVTESAVMTDVDRFREVLVALKALGVGVSIDDFGSGYSSLSRVRRFPAVDELKIDRSFVRELSVSQGIAVVKAIVAMGHTIGSTVTAEGVEHDREATLLRDIGCDVAQGFLYSAPQPADVIAPMLGAPGAGEWKLPPRYGRGLSVTPRPRARARNPLPPTAL